MRELSFLGSIVPKEQLLGAHSCVGVPQSSLQMPRRYFEESEIANEGMA
jgi:hypothetical protein